MRDKLVLLNLDDLIEDPLGNKVNSDIFNANITSDIVELSEQNYYFGVFSKNKNDMEIRGILNANGIDTNLFEYFIGNPYTNCFKFGVDVIKTIFKNEYEIDDVLIINCFHYISIFQYMNIKETIVRNPLKIKDVILSLLPHKE